MKILYVSPRPIPSLSANSVHMMKMAQAMAQHGHKVILSCYRGGVDEVGQGAMDDPFAYYHASRTFDFLPFAAAKGKVGRRMTQILFARRNAAMARECDLMFSRCLLSAVAGAISGSRVIFELHDSPSTLHPIMLGMFNRLIKNSNFLKLVVISQALKDHIVSEFGVGDNKIIVAHDGADALPHIGGRPSPFQKNDFAFHVGYTGHLYKGRGIEVMAGAAELLPSVAFHIVGGTPEDVKCWAQQYSNLDNLIFHGHVPHALVAEYLKHFDALLAPYQHSVAVAGNTGNTVNWMSPLKIFEYMSAGKPMIVSDLPVLAEVLGHGRNAYLCAPDSAKAWADAIDVLRADPALSARLAVQALKEFDEHYTWSKRAKYILDHVI